MVVDEPTSPVVTLTALELINRVAADNGWSVISTWYGEYHLIKRYGRWPVYIEVRYSPSHGVHSARRIVEFTERRVNEWPFVEVGHVGPNTTGRRAAAIRWLKS